MTKNKPIIYTKQSLLRRFKEISGMGWIKTKRPGNDGAVGNTLEDLLGIKENNLPLPNAAEWELKAQRKSTTSLTTLLHSEPSPQGARVVPSILLPYMDGSMGKLAKNILPMKKAFAPL